jgi:hypothetical protein
MFEKDAGVTSTTKILILKSVRVKNDSLRLRLSFFQSEIVVFCLNCQSDKAAEAIFLGYLLAHASTYVCMCVRAHTHMQRYKRIICLRISDTGTREESWALLRNGPHQAHIRKQRKKRDSYTQKEAWIRFDWILGLYTRRKIHVCLKYVLFDCTLLN